MVELDLLTGPYRLLISTYLLTLSLLLLCHPAAIIQSVRGLKELLRTATLCLFRSGLGGARHPAPPPA